MLESTSLLLYDSRVNKLKEIINDKKNFYNAIRDYNYFSDILEFNDFKAILRTKNNRKAKRSRTFKKVQNVLYAPAYRGAQVNILFGTATFDNKTLFKKNGKQLKIETLNKKINEYIKRNFELAVVNVDFGEKNERIHYHWIGITKEHVELVSTGKKSKKYNELYNIKNDSYDYGFAPVYAVINLEEMKATSNYLLKINNHSNKTTTKNYRIKVIGNKKLIEDIKNLREHLKIISR